MKYNSVGIKQTPQWIKSPEDRVRLLKELREAYVVHHRAVLDVHAATRQRPQFKLELCKTYIYSESGEQGDNGFVAVCQCSGEKQGEAVTMALRKAGAAVSATMLADAGMDADCPPLVRWGFVLYQRFGNGPSVRLDPFAHSIQLIEEMEDAPAQQRKRAGGAPRLPDREAKRRRRIVADYKQSGQSRKEYCEAKNIALEDLNTCCDYARKRPD